MNKYLLLLFCCLTPLATAAEIEMTDAWARATVGTMRTSAVYGTLHNQSSTDLTLVQVSSPVAKRAELHTHTQNEQGVMRMTQLQSITIPAGEQHVFKPGADHIMLLHLNQNLEADTEIPLRLEFANGNFRNIRAVVRPLSHHMKNDHKSHDHH